MVAAGRGARGRTPRDPCRSEGSETQCYLAHEREYLGIYGLAPAAEQLAAGTAIRRAMFVDGYGRDLVAVEFRRAAGSPPSVGIFLPLTQGQTGYADPAMVAPVAL